MKKIKSLVSMPEGRNDKSDVMWLDRMWYPVYFGFCPNEEAWKKEVKRLNLTLHEAPYPTKKDACCSTFTLWGEASCIITVGKSMDVKNLTHVFSLLSHECVHIWQEICEQMGEKHPSEEFEAYTVQYLSLEICNAYMRSGRYEGIEAFKQHYNL